jgi:hypothetical protein
MKKGNSYFTKKQLNREIQHNSHATRREHITELPKSGEVVGKLCQRWRYTVAGKRGRYIQHPHLPTSCTYCELMNNRENGKRWTRQVRGPVSEREWGPGSDTGTDNQWRTDEAGTTQVRGPANERKCGLVSEAEPWTRERKEDRRTTGRFSD